MKKLIFPANVFVLITTSEELRAQEASPSFLTKDYDLPTMLSFFQKKFSEEISLDDLEESFKKPESPIPSDIAKMKTIATSKEDFDEKIKQLISLKVHSYSKDSLLILLGKLLFTNEQWFIDNKDEAVQLFQKQVFDKKFFDQRRNDLCLLIRKKI